MILNFIYYMIYQSLHKFVSVVSCLLHPRHVRKYWRLSLAQVNNPSTGEPRNAGQVVNMRDGDGFVENGRLYT